MKEMKTTTKTEKNSVLLSIKPEFAEKIRTGEKTYELRRVNFQHKTLPKTIYVYETDPVKAIIGHFTCDKIIKMPLLELWDELSEKTGISEERFYEYFRYKKFGYGLRISDYTPLIRPVLLKELVIGTAPQSFRYLSFDQADTLQQIVANGLSSENAVNHSNPESDVEKTSCP